MFHQSQAIPMQYFFLLKAEKKTSLNLITVSLIDIFLGTELLLNELKSEIVFIEETVEPLMNYFFIYYRIAGVRWVCYY